jgi:hypothetical protein
MTFASAIYQEEWVMLNALLENIKEGEVVPVRTRKEKETMEVQFHSFLKPGGEWSAQCFGCFTPRESASISTEQEDGWVPELVWMILRR